MTTGKRRLLWLPRSLPLNSCCVSWRNYEKNVLQRSENSKSCVKVDAKISHQEGQAGQMETDSTCLSSVHRQPASQQLMGCMIKLREE